MGWIVDHDCAITQKIAGIDKKTNFI